MTEVGIKFLPRPAAGQTVSQQVFLFGMKPWEQPLRIVWDGVAPGPQLHHQGGGPGAAPCPSRCSPTVHQTPAPGGSSTLPLVQTLAPTPQGSWAVRREGPVLPQGVPAGPKRPTSTGPSGSAPPALPTSSAGHCHPCTSRL